MEAENFDRLDMRLPGYQEKMLQDVINNGRFVVFLGLYLNHAVLGMSILNSLIQLRISGLGCMFCLVFCINP